LRSRIVLLAADGLANKEIARRQGCSQPMAGKWRQRFLDFAVDGLLDEPRPGTPRKLSDKQVERVLTRTLESQPEDATHWSTRDMAKACGLSQQSTISRIWRAFSLAPHRSAEFRNFLDTIEKNVPTELDVHRILDNYGTHKTQTICNWLAKRPRFHLRFTPTSASWLNLVERWFAALTEKQLRRGVHRSTRELENAIGTFIQHHNQDPKPFVWHKTADQILDSVARFGIRTSDSGH
jgi:transposase